MEEKPLFVPLRTRWFRAFEAGTKTIEYRLHGARWNARTCRPGRRVTLSHGYSGARLSARIVSTREVSVERVPAALELYPAGSRLLAIRLSIDR